MKTLEDFKGTKEVTIMPGFDGARKILFLMDKDDTVARLGLLSWKDTRANAKLFAKSYKLLEAADKLMKHIKSCGEPYENRVEVVELQQAIQDCL